MKNGIIAAVVATLAVATSGADAAVLNLSTFATNGSATVSTNQIVLTPNAEDKAGSAYSTSMFSTDSNFSVSFDFSADTESYRYRAADGFTFLFQSAGLNALGSGGGALGAEGISPSAGIAFRSYIYNDAGIFQDGNVFDGAKTPFAFGLSNSGTVSVNYDAFTKQLSYTAFNGSTGGTAVGSATIDLASLLGSSAYFGFTGATGAATSAQTISNVNLTVAAVPEPTTWAMMLIGFGMVAGAARYRRRSAAITYA